VSRTARMDSRLSVLLRQEEHSGASGGPSTGGAERRFAYDATILTTEGAYFKCPQSQDVEGGKIAGSRTEPTLPQSGGIANSVATASLHGVCSSTRSGGTFQSGLVHVETPLPALRDEPLAGDSHDPWERLGANPQYGGYIAHYLCLRCDQHTDRSAAQNRTSARTATPSKVTASPVATELFTRTA